MRILALFVFLFLTLCFSKSTVAQSTYQSSRDSTVASRYVYCELVGMQKFLSTKVTVVIDYGEETKFFSDNRLRDNETGKVRTFNSMVDALNYMGSNGWEFVQAYVVTNGQQNIYRWLLKMKMKMKKDDNPLNVRPK